MADSTTDDLLAAIRRLPLDERLRLVDQAAREIGEDTPKPGPVSAAPSLPGLSSHMEQRGRLLVYTGYLPDPALDHRVDREERADHLIAQLDAGRV